VNPKEKNSDQLEPLWGKCTRLGGSLYRWSGANQRKRGGGDVNRWLERGREGIMGWNDYHGFRLDQAEGGAANERERGGVKS